MKTTSRHAKLVVSSDGAGIVGQAGGVLLTEALRATGLDQALSAGLERWRTPRATHDPGKVVADLAVMLTLGGDCLADVAVLRSSPELFGPVASDPGVAAGHHSGPGRFAGVAGNPQGRRRFARCR